MTDFAPTGPCAGIRVLDLTTMVAGSLAGSILGDLGAEVVKIEPLTGEMVRQMEPIHKGMSAEFVQYNRNKRSIAVNLKTAAGLEVARRLSAQVDVVLENSRPGVMERLGLGPKELMERNPGLVYVSVNGFGPSGPYADRPAYDGLLQGLVGAMTTQGQGGPPQPIYNAIADKITAVMASHSTLAALLHRERNGGIGQRVSVSMLDAFASFFLVDQLYRHTFQDAENLFMPEGKNYFPLATSDGYVIGLIASDQQFQAGCETFGAEHLLEDARFATMTDRIRNLSDMWHELGKASLKIDTETVLERAAARSLALARVNTISEFFDDPQVRHNGTVIDVPDDELGTIRQLKHAARFESTPVENFVRAPRLGQHSDQILRELGYGEEDLAQLRLAGVVA